MTDFTADMLATLSSAYTSAEGTNLYKLFSLFGDTLADIDNAAKTILAYRDVDNADGVTLDRWGRNVGVPREGMSDTVYRLYIKQKLSSLVSGCDVDTIINLTASLLNIAPSEVGLDEASPAKVVITIADAALESIGIGYAQGVAVVHGFLRKMVAAGVDITLVTSVPTFDTVYGGSGSASNPNTLYGGSASSWSNGGNTVDGNH